MNWVRKYFLELFCLLLYLFWLLIYPDSGYDKLFDKWWMQDLMNDGFSNIYYTPTVNYPPLVLYFLEFFTWFYDSSDQITVSTVNELKSIKILFDVLIIYVFGRILKQFQLPLKYLFLFVLNMAFWYNSVIWAQYDSIVAFLIIGSLWMGFQKKFTTSILFFLLALNTKQIAIIYTPLIFILNFPLFKSFRKSLKSILILTSVQLIILLPFIFHGTLDVMVTSLLKRSISHHPSLSMNANNIWVFFYDELNLDSSKQFIGGINLIHWGMLLFFTYTLILFVPLIKRGLALRFDQLILLGGLIGLAFYFFNTQMHERYLHIPFLLLGIFSVLKRKRIILTAFSIVYFLTLERVMKFTRYFDWELININNYNNSILLQPLFLAICTTLLLILFSFIWIKTVVNTEK